MPRSNRFDRDRMNKLLGEKHKPIKKEDIEKMYIKPIQKEEKGIPPKIQTKHQCNPPQPITTRPFKSSNYVVMQKNFYIKHQGQQTQKLNFRCYNDTEIFGEEMIKFLKKTYDQDHETPPEQVRFDVSVGIKRLKESLDTYVGNDNDCASSVRSAGSKGMLRIQSVSDRHLFSKKLNFSVQPTAQKQKENEGEQN